MDLNILRQALSPERFEDIIEKALRDGLCVPPVHRKGRRWAIESPPTGVLRDGISNTASSSLKRTETNPVDGS